MSEREDVRLRMTLQDKFTSCIAADKNYLCDFKIISPTLQVSAINNYQEKSGIFTIPTNFTLFLSKQKNLDILIYRLVFGTIHLIGQFETNAEN